MATTIQISNELLGKLQDMKMFVKESYEDIIWDLIEDRMELSEETKKNIVQSEKDIKNSKTVSLEDVKKKWLKNVQN